MVRQIVASLVAAILAGSQAESAESDRIAPPPTYRVGDSWLLRISGDARGRPQRASIARIEGERVVMLQGPAKEEAIYDLQLNKLEAHEPPSGRLVRYEPNNRNFVFPLRPGKEWGGRVEWSAGPYQGSTTVKGRAIGWEEVDFRFEAGSRRGEVEKLEALRIEYRHERDGNVTKSTCWYAPAIRFAVRCESADPAYSHEVIDYTLGEGDAVELPAERDSDRSP